MHVIGPSAPLQPTHPIPRRRQHPRQEAVIFVHRLVGVAQRRLENRRGPVHRIKACVHWIPSCHQRTPRWSAPLVDLCGSEEQAEMSQEPA